MAYVSIDMVVCWVEEKIFEMRVAPIPSYAADGYARDVISKEYGKICEKYGVEPSSQDNFNVTSGSFTVGRGINKTKKNKAVIKIGVPKGLEKKAEEGVLNDLRRYLSEFLSRSYEEFAIYRLEKILSGNGYSDPMIIKNGKSILALGFREGSWYSCRLPFNQLSRPDPDLEKAMGSIKMTPYQ